MFDQIYDINEKSNYLNSINSKYCQKKQIDFFHLKF